ncbi:MAG TPA: zinc ribbon domain-containing protein [Vicinamibacterales bacterium]|nr:zinc ribbon domain-containing protein [Vicinamibacterales bacterium]
MPLYEYECSACGHRFELIRRFSDPPADTCPACGQGPLNKLLSAPAVHFKGTGWYVTDYAKKTGASAVKTDAGPGDTPAGESKTADEKKPAATETKAADDKKPAAAVESKPAKDSSQ